MRSLVTGAAGFVGHHLITHLLASDDEVVAVDRHVTALIPSPPAAGLATSNGVATSAKISIEIGDICDRESVLRIVERHKPQVIYHLAGMAFAPDAEKDFNSALLTNVGGTHNICWAAAECGIEAKILVISSSEVYGRVQPEDLPLTESSPTRPGHNYGLSKAMAELVCQRFMHYPRLGLVVARAFNHIGPGQRSDFVVPSLALQLAEMAVGKRPPLIEIGNLTPERDFTDVRDIVAGYRLAALRGSGIYNLCSGTPVAISTILSELIAISGLEVEIRQDASRMRPAEVPRLWGSYERAKRELGWEPRFDRHRSLSDVYQWCLRHVGG